MKATDGDLALRKEVLLTRSALLRLKLRHEVLAIRRGLTWREAGTTLARSPPARDAVFLVAAEALGRERTARWLAQALAIVGIAKVTLALLQTRRDNPPETVGPSSTQPGEPV